ncbi:hypothetical protein [Natrarchaeobaculum aegyptiacum]|uniref:Cox cluster protein n=1 Tax=Natrarchaeobaculum aegyptiacum TaxID=745377 RepID=A0A2Z2HQE1_9EURY|nr:hypothetical protein [Natrarchaeobaculum aegyptiacum]ARS89152.1 hypothetical protein B1756_04875 [Natrarchaeobaculum aegyptiacum]
MSDPGEQTATLGIVVGAILAVVGIAAYVLSEFASATALIPTIFGAIIAILGTIGRTENRERLAVYGIGLFAALGVLGSLRAVPDIVALATGDAVDSVVAPVTQGVMIVFCLVLVGGVVRYVGATR